MNINPMDKTFHHDNNKYLDNDNNVNALNENNNDNDKDNGSGNIFSFNKKTGLHSGNSIMFSLTNIYGVSKRKNLTMEMIISNTYSTFAIIMIILIIYTIYIVINVTKVINVDTEPLLINNKYVNSCAAQKYSKAFYIIESLLLLLASSKIKSIYNGKFIYRENKHLCIAIIIWLTTGPPVYVK